MKKCILINKSGRKDLGAIEPLIHSLMGFAQKYMKFGKAPKLELHSDAENSRNILGKTAHYDPVGRTIAIYVDARHPKDILRSIAHELVHHTQNLRGDFAKIGDTGPGYAQKDPHLRGMEKEAYQTGNMCFRDWEDEHKRLQNESKRKNTTMSRLKEDKSLEVYVGGDDQQFRGRPTYEAENETDDSEDNEKTIAKEDADNDMDPSSVVAKTRHKPSTGEHSMNQLEEAVRGAIKAFLDENQTYEVNEEIREKTPEEALMGSRGEQRAAKEGALGAGTGGSLAGMRPPPPDPAPRYAKPPRRVRPTKTAKALSQIKTANLGQASPALARLTGTPLSKTDYTAPQNVAAREAFTKTGDTTAFEPSQVDKIKAAAKLTPPVPVTEQEELQESLDEWYGGQLFESLKRKWAK